MVSSGGRVLTVVGVGTDLAEARMSAYEGIARISLDGSFYRRDIAERAAAGQIGVEVGR
jgi:phosphoribosylamine--glycine ligase